jgi:hypothetical protein
LHFIGHYEAIFRRIPFLQRVVTPTLDGRRDSAALSPSTPPRILLSWQH